MQGTYGDWIPRHSHVIDIAVWFVLGVIFRRG
jgi:hypothetical protein